MTTRHFLFSGALAALLFTGAGCISINSGTTGSGAADGGIFKSGNKGDNWVQKVAVPTVTGEKRNIAGVSVVTIVQDPQDVNALYIGTEANGMFYTYDGGESWMQSVQVSRGRIPAVGIDAKNKCAVYVAVDNKIVKTTDCSRTWVTPYTDTRSDALTTALAVDAYNPRIVWAGNSKGDVLKSTDGGESWVNAKHFNGPIVEIAISAADTRHVYVGTKNNGIWRSDDGGANWKELTPGYQQFAGSNEFFDLALGVSDPRLVIFASKHGLLRSTDGGDTWQSIDLLTPPGTTLIYSVAIDPKDVNTIYYGTATTFYRTTNGGANWVPKKLPTSRTATSLHVDSMNSNMLYMGVTRFKQ